MPNKRALVLPERVWHLFSEDGRMYAEDWFTTKRAALAWSKAMAAEHGEKWVVRSYSLATPSGSIATKGNHE